MSAAPSVEDCKLACIFNASCTGVNWNPWLPAGRRCWLSGPWPGHSYRHGGFSDVTHYELIYVCAGESIQQMKVNNCISLESRYRAFADRRGLLIMILGVVAGVSWAEINNIMHAVKTLFSLSDNQRSVVCILHPKTWTNYPRANALGSRKFAICALVIAAYLQVGSKQDQGWFWSSWKCDIFPFMTMLAFTYSTAQVFFSFYRAMLAQSAVMRLHVVCLSVCLSVCDV